MVRVYRGDDGGPRCSVLGLRVHHGLCGALCVLVGALLLWHDRSDARSWLALRTP